MFIQQDNANIHICCDSLYFLTNFTSWILYFFLMCQPPHSPYLNIFDIEFLNAIQSLQFKKPTKSIDDYNTP